MTFEVDQVIDRLIDITTMYERMMRLLMTRFPKDLSTANPWGNGEGKHYMKYKGIITDEITNVKLGFFMFMMLPYNGPTINGGKDFVDKLSVIRMSTKPPNGMYYGTSITAYDNENPEHVLAMEKVMSKELKPYTPEEFKNEVAEFIEDYVTWE